MKFKDLYNMLSESEADSKLQLARELVEKQFQNVKRSGGIPYTVHLNNVFEGVRNEKPNDIELQISALLHDSYEDGYMTLDEVEQMFGGRVKYLVDSVSRKPTETYSDFIDRIISSGTDSCIIKLSDLKDNIKDVASFKPSLLGRYQKAIEKIEDFLNK